MDESKSFTVHSLLTLTFSITQAGLLKILLLISPSANTPSHYMLWLARVLVTFVFNLSSNKDSAPSLWHQACRLSRLEDFCLSDVVESEADISMWHHCRHINYSVWILCSLFTTWLLFSWFTHLRSLRAAKSYITAQTGHILTADLITVVYLSVKQKSSPVCTHCMKSECRYHSIWLFMRP